MLNKRTPALALLLLAPLPASAADVAGGILQGIFGGLNGDGPMASMFAAWNASVMFIASIIIGYTIYRSMIETAHDGEVLGKKMSSIWIPGTADIRVKIGLSG